MFEIGKLEVRCTSASTNQEKQGQSEDTRLGMSMYFEFLASNDLLNMLDKKLRPAFYERAAGDQQEDITGHLPLLKFKGLDPLKYPYEREGYTATIHPNLEASKDFVIKDCKVDRFKLTMKDDGIVNYRLRIYFHPDDSLLDKVGQLCNFVSHNVTLSLEPPKVSEQQGRQPAAEASPQPDMIDTAEAQSALDALYPRAVAAVRATQNPTASALQTELKIDFNSAAQLLARMFDDEIIYKDANDEYHVSAENAA